MRSVNDKHQAICLSRTALSVAALPDAVRSVFKVIAGFAPGGQVAFTFGTPDQVDSPLAMRVRAMGEPWLSAYTAAQISAQLLGAGFSQVEFLSPEAADRRYFQNRADVLKAPPLTNIGLATVE